MKFHFPKKGFFSKNKNGLMAKFIMENYLNNFYLDYLFEVTDCRDYALIFLIDSVTIHLTTDKFNSNTKKMRKFYQKIFK